MPPITSTISIKPQKASRAAMKRSRQFASGMRGQSSLRARYHVVIPSIAASTNPGTIPAMNKAPTEVLVDTEYITITIEGGMRMPSAPDVVITPAPNRLG